MKLFLLLIFVNNFGWGATDDDRVKPLAMGGELVVSTLKLSSFVWPGSDEGANNAGTPLRRTVSQSNLASLASDDTFGDDIFGLDYLPAHVWDAFRTNRVPALLKTLSYIPEELKKKIENCLNLAGVVPIDYNAHILRLMHENEITPSGDDVRRLIQNLLVSDDERSVVLRIYDQHCIKETESIVGVCQLVKEKYPQGGILALDIDGTVLSEGYRYLLYSPIEEGLSKHLKEMRRQGWKVVFLTARSEETAKITEKQLKEHGLLAEGKNPNFSDQIYYTSGDEKGRHIYNLLAVMNCNQNQPVVFCDNMHLMLTSVRNTLCDAGSIEDQRRRLFATIMKWQKELPEDERLKNLLKVLGYDNFESFGATALFIKESMARGKIIDNDVSAFLEHYCQGDFTEGFHPRDFYHGLKVELLEVFYMTGDNPC